MLSCFLFVCFAPLSGNNQGWSYSFVTKRFVWVGVVEKTWLLALRNDWMVTKRNSFYYKETTSIMINGFHNANWLPLASTKKNGARSSHQRCSMKNVFLRNFTKFTKQYLRQSLFFNKVADLGSVTLLKKKLWHRCFPVNFAKFLRKPFLQNTSGRLCLFGLY